MQETKSITTRISGRVKTNINNLIAQRNKAEMELKAILESLINDDSKEITEFRLSGDDIIINYETAQNAEQAVSKQIDTKTVPIDKNEEA